MKKRVLSVVLCLCLASASIAGCSKSEKEADKTTGETTKDIIKVEDDNVDYLHKHLMKHVGDSALKCTTIKDYFGMEVEVEPKVELTDTMFQEELDYVLEQYPYVFSGAVVSGETVNLDYAGSIDGVAFEGGTATGASLVIGSGRFSKHNIEGFEEQLIGMNVGDTKTINVTFPSEYDENPDLAGKEAQYVVTINNRMLVSGKAELTEQWVAAYLTAVGGVVTDASVDGFKSYYRKLLEESYANTRKSNELYAIQEKMLELVKTKDVPKSQTTYFENLIAEENEAQMQSSYGMTLEDYLKQTGMSQKDYDKMVSESAEEYLKYQYAIITIGEKEKLAPTEEEYTACLQEYAEYNSMTVDEFRKACQSRYQADLYFYCYANKVLNAIREKAVFKDIVEDASGSAAEAAE